MRIGNLKNLWVTLIMGAMILTQVGGCAKKEEARKPGKLPKVAAAKPRTSLPAIDIPAPPPVEDVVGYLRVGNITAVLNVVDSWVSQVNPDMPQGAIKMQAGQFLGDPTLAGIDVSKPLLIVALNPSQYPNPFVLYLPIADAAKIESAIRGKGALTVKKGDILIVGDDQQCVTRGAELFNQIKPFIASPLDTDLALFVDVDKLMSLYGEDIKKKVKGFQNQIAMMQQMQMGQKGVSAKQKELETQVEEAFKWLGELKIVALKANARKEGLELTFLGEAKPQTEIAGLLTAESVPSPSLPRFLPYGALRVSITGNFEKLTDAAAQMSFRILEKSGKLTPEQLQDVKAYNALGRGVQGDEATMCMFIPGGKGLSGVFLNKIKDPAKALELMRQAPKQQALMINNPAQGTTAQGTFTEKARTVDGVDVHSLKLSITSTNPMAAQMFMMFMPGGSLDIEMAIVNDVMITAMGTPIDNAIRAIKSGTGNTPLVAHSAFPKNGQLYGDLDVIGFVNNFVAPMFAPMMGMMGATQNPFTKLQNISAPPVTFFATMHDGKVMAQVNFPLEIVVKIKGAFSPAQ